jgi:putative Holliday junction resolvase
VSRILAVDWGRRRLGLAVSDPERILARPLPTLTVSGADEAVAGVRSAADREEAGVILVGLPLDMDGGEGASARQARALGDALRRLGFTVIFHDERLTTEAARDHLRSRGERRPPRERIDQVAALLLLQEYLDHGTTGHE